MRQEFSLAKFDEYREDNRREVKKANGGLPNSLWDAYSSFANCYGGVIILGVKEEKDGSWRTTGLKNEAKLRKDFWDTINNPKKVNLVKIHSTCCKLSGMLYYKKYLSYCTVVPKKMYGKDGEKMIPPVRIHGRKWDVEEWSMFKEIRDERAFNGILNQIIENIQNGSLKAGDALPAERTMAEIMGVSRPAVREALRALELLGIVKPVPGGGNYITEDLDTWLIEPLSILFKLNNGYLRQNQQFRAALEREAAILAARKCTQLDAAELWVILARLDAAEDEKIRGELDRELHKKIAKIADNPMVYSVLAAADQLTENIVSGTRDYIMKKNNSVREVDDQHHRLVKAIINGDAEQAERCMSEHMDTIERYMEEMQKKS